MQKFMLALDRQQPGWAMAHALPSELAAISAGDWHKADETLRRLVARRLLMAVDACVNAKLVRVRGANLLTERAGEGPVAPPFLDS